MTTTPELNPLFSLMFFVIFGAGAIVEIIGIRRKKKGDTITENWRWIERWLPSSWAWAFRVATGGMLVWMILHFLVGAD